MAAKKISAGELRRSASTNDIYKTRIMHDDKWYKETVTNILFGFGLPMEDARYIVNFSPVDDYRVHGYDPKKTAKILFDRISPERKSAAKKQRAKYNP